MIENYKGWDITLNCYNDYYPKGGITQSLYNKKKWVGVHPNGEKVYGSSLKEIRHIIDYPCLYKK